MQFTGLLRSIHMDKAHMLKCNQCNGASSYNKTLKDHLKRCGKAENKEFQCSQCPAKFTTQRSQSRHEVSQHQDMPNICETCGQEFRYQFAYRRHIERKHKNLSNFPTHVTKSCGSWSCSIALEPCHDRACMSKSVRSDTKCFLQQIIISNV